MPAASTTHSFTLDRGLRALEVLAEHPAGLTISELADLLGTHRPAVYRLLGPLSEHHLVRRDDSGRLRLAPGLISLAAAVRPRLYEISEPILQRISETLGATAALTIRDGGDAVVARVVVPRSQPMHLTYRQGMRHPLTHGAPGHVLLAAGPPTREEPPEVTEARARGYGFSHSQLMAGATGVAAAIVAPRHEPEAAISAVWIAGLDPDRAAREVVAAADEIARQMA